MDPKLEATLVKFLSEATIYLERLNGQEMLPFAGAKTTKTDKPAKKEKPKAEPKPAPAPEFPPEHTEAKAEKKPEPVEGYEKVLVDPTEAESLPLALATAKDFVQRFSKSEPDGIARLRKILAEVFKAPSIGKMNHAQRVELIKVLTEQLAEAAK